MRKRKLGLHFFYAFLLKFRDIRQQDKFSEKNDVTSVLHIQSALNCLGRSDIYTMSEIREVPGF